MHIVRLEVFNLGAVNAWPNDKYDICITCGRKPICKQASVVTSVASWCETLTSMAYSNAPFGSTRSRLTYVFVVLNRLYFGLSGSRIKLSAIFRSVYKVISILNAHFNQSTRMWLYIQRWHGPVSWIGSYDTWIYETSKFLPLIMLFDKLCRCRRCLRSQFLHSACCSFSDWIMRNSSILHCWGLQRMGYYRTTRGATRVHSHEWLTQIYI